MPLVNATPQPLHYSPARFPQPPSLLFSPWGGTASQGPATAIHPKFHKLFNPTFFSSFSGLSFDFMPSTVIL